MLQKTFLSFLEKAMNLFIAKNDAKTILLPHLQGKTILLIIEPLSFHLFMQFNETGVSLLDTFEGEVDTTLKSHLGGFIQLGLLPQSRIQELFQKAVSLQGSVETGEKVKQLFDIREIDWEGELARFVGDPLAFHIGKTVSSLHQFQKNVKDRFLSELGSWLTKEKEIFPTQKEGGAFCDDVDTLSHDVSRLQAKMRREGI